MDRETVGRVREQSALWEDDELVALCDALLEAWDENDRKDDLIAYSASMSLRIADGVEKLPAVAPDGLALHIDGLVEEKPTDEEDTEA